MNHHDHSGSMRNLAILAGLFLLLGAASNRGFFHLDAPQAKAVGGYSAVDALGQLDTAGEPVYGVFKQNNGPNEFGFDLAYDVAMDSVRHRLFVSDFNNSRVLVYDLDVSNELLDRVADNVIGQATFKGRNSGVTAATTNGPVGLTVDEAGGRLFVADQPQNRVLVFDVTTIDDGEDAVNVLGQTDFVSGGDTLPTQSTLTRPGGLAYDSTSDRLFVVEAGGVNRVTVFDVAAIDDGEDAINVIGQPNFTAFGLGATTQDRLNNPTDVAIDETGQRLFVVDANNNRVTVFDVNPSVLIPDNSGTDGPNAINVLGQTNFTSSTSGLSVSKFNFDQASGITYDNNADRLFVADGVFNDRVLIFDVSTIDDGEDAVNVLGQTDFTTVIGGTPSQSHFGSHLGSLFYDVDNDLFYVADAFVNRVLVFDALAIVDGEAAVNQLGQLNPDGSPFYDVANYPGDIPDNGPSDRGFAYPESVALDTTNHRMFVTDAANHRVLVFDLDTDNLLVDHLADHVLGQEDFKGQDVTVDADGLQRPSALAYREQTGQLFVADQDHNRVMVFDVNAITDGEDAVNVLGQAVFTTSAAATTATGMNTPRAVAVDHDGERLFVADASNNRVLVYDLHEESPGIDDGEAAVNVLGQIDFTSNNTGNGMSELNGPLGAAYDGGGQRLFIVDGENNRVLVFDVATIDDGEAAANQLGTGSRAISQNEFSLDLLDQSFTEPCVEGGTNAQPVFDAANNRVFIPDSCNSRIMVFDTTTIEDQEDAVDVVGATDFTSGGGGAQDQLSTPEGLAFNPANNYLYVADTGNHRVMVFEVPPLVPVVTGGHEATDVLGQLNDVDAPLFTTGGADNGPNRRGSSEPVAVEVDHINHRLFLSDYDNGRILVYDLDSSDVMIDRVADAVLGQDDFKHGICGGEANRICNPGGLALDAANGLLFVAAYGNNRVMVFDVNEVTSGEAAVNVLGQPDFDSSTAEASQTGMNHPGAVEWYEEDQELFVADFDNNRVLAFDLSGGITNGMPASHVLGQPNFDTNTPGLSATQMELPSGVEYVGSIDPSGLELLYVSDRANCRVIAFDISTIDDGEAAQIVLGQPDFDTKDCGSDSNSMGEFGLSGISHDEAGNLLFVTDFANNRVMVFDVELISPSESAVAVLGQPDFDTNTATTGPEGLNDPEGVYYDDAHDLLYITDTGNHRVLAYDGTALSNGVAAIDGFSQLNPDDTPNYTAEKPNNGSNAQGVDASPGVALDAVRHRLFVSDWANSRVLVFALDDSNQPLDHTADFVLGQPDFKTYAAATSDSGLSQPLLISYDAADDLLFVADNGNGRVMVWDTDVITNGEPAVYVLGKPDFDTAGGGTSISELSCPQGVSIEPLNGILAVGDTCNNRALIYDLGGPGLPSLASGMDAAKVFGEPDFDTNVCDTGSGGMCHPVGVLAETNNDSLWVADVDNNRVLRFDLFSASSAPAANVLGQDNFLSNAAVTSQNGFDQPHGVALVERDDGTQRLFVGDHNNNRVMVFDTSDGIDDGEDAVDAYGQGTFSTADCETSITGLCGPKGVDYDESSNTLYVGDDANNRVLLFGPTPSGGGGGGSPPTPVRFTPKGIEVNRNDEETDSRNVLVTIHAENSSTFSGTVYVLLSNTSDFSTVKPYTFEITEGEDAWPKVVPWDLCFGITETTACSLGNKVVYARFYINTLPPVPVLVPHDVLISR